MERFYKNKWMKEIIVTTSSILILIFTLPVLFGRTMDGVNAFTCISEGYDSMYLALVLILLLAVTDLVALITIPLVWIKKKGYMPLFITGFILPLALFILCSINKFLPAGKNVLLVLAFVVSLFGIVYSFIGLRYRSENPAEAQDKEERAHFLPVLVLNILSAVSLLMIFFIPVFTYKNAKLSAKTVTFIQGFAGTSDPVTFAGFLVAVLALIAAISLLFSCITSYFYKNESFVLASKRSMYFDYGVSIVFFVAGITTVFVYLLDGSEEASTISYIPFLIYSVLMVVHSLINGRNAAMLQPKKKMSFKGKYSWLLFLFITLFTAVTYLTLMMPFLNVTYSDGSVSQTLKLTGYDLIKNVSTLDSSYRPASFIMYVIVMASGILYVLALMAFIGRSPEIRQLGYAAVVVNFLFVAALGIFGAYYSIAQKIDMEVLNTYFQVKYPLISSFINLDSCTATVKSDSFFMVFLDTALASLMFIIKPISRGASEIAGTLGISADAPLSISVSDENKPEEDAVPSEEEKPMESPEEGLPSFDACPAFSELDSMKDEFDAAMEERRTKLFESPSLPSLVQFIVDYARESRLHLSYTPEDIAEFTAGLGASRLTILQGMSGTGKTSLPKIFLEAILGNCEIIEVESSWKDKNELLGYYNEFSKTFTPKKFTRALYKASLNQDAVTFIVLDEMNLSRIEYYFSDFLSLMENEPENREIQLLNVKLYNTYDGAHHSYMALKNDHTLHIPENVWFIGTANRDESTFEISDKVYDRAHTMNFNHRAPKVRNYGNPMAQRFLSCGELVQMLDAAEAASTFDLESVPFLKMMEDALRPYNISFGNRILNQIEAFVKIYAACFNNSPEAVSDGLERILLTKVVSKLEFKTIEDKDELARKFEKMNLMKCADFIRSLNEDI